MNKNKLVYDLGNILGGSNVITDEKILEDYATDTVGYRLWERYNGKCFARKPVCIVRPSKVREVSDVLKYLNENKITCIPSTGRSCATAGLEVITDNTVVLDGSGMNKLIKFDEENMYVQAEAGLPLEYLEQYCNKKGYTTGHMPQSIPLAQLGGLTATRSIGQFSTLYGGIEDMVIALEAVLPNGEVIRIKNVPRRAAGPDLRHIFIGSEGVLAYITEVTLKIYKFNPADRWMQAYTVKDMKTGIDMIREIMVNGYKPAVVRLHDAGEASSSYSTFIKQNECILLLIADGPKNIVNATASAVDDISKRFSAKSIGRKPVEIWLEHRNDLSYQLSDNANLRNALVFDTCEIAANWSELAPLYDRIINRVIKENDALVSFTGHISHCYVQGANIYFMFTYKADKNFQKTREIYKNIQKTIFEETLKVEGGISHHHGIGKYRAAYIKDELGSSYSVLKTIKDALDPNGIMNKGTLLE
jgi:alkyldihydroxyacetonephosphate synthase